MAEPTERKHAALAGVYLIEMAIERLGWPAIVVVVAMSDAGTAFIGLLNKLLTLGPGHFWAFVVLVAGFFALGSLVRRRNETMQRQATRLREIAEENRDLKSEIKRYREHQENHP